VRTVRTVRTVVTTATTARKDLGGVFRERASFQKINLARVHPRAASISISIAIAISISVSISISISVSIVFEGKPQANAAFATMSRPKIAALPTRHPKITKRKTFVETQPVFAHTVFTTASSLEAPATASPSRAAFVT